MSVGIPARSLANVRCGGTTRLSNFLHALFLLILVGVGSGLIARIPLAALAGVTAYVGISLLEWSTWRRLHRMRRRRRDRLPDDGPGRFDDRCRRWPSPSAARCMSFAIFLTKPRSLHGLPQSKRMKLNRDIVAKKKEM